MKKILSMLLACVLVFSAVGCGSSEAGTDKKDFKLGLICLHDESSTYDNNFIEAAKAAADELGVQLIIKRNIPEGAECETAAKDLVDEGCKVIFADSFGHEDYIISVAKANPNVQFCHATGTKAHTENLSNFHNAFASIYEGRYIAGVAAGLKLQEMMKNDSSVKPVIGYVGAFTYAEVISGYTSYFLGVKSIVPEVTMKVKFTGSWYDEVEEKNAAGALIDAGCVIISQHADSWGAPSICEERNVPNISYNGSTEKNCPNTFVISSKINWAPYFKYICENTMAGKAFDTDYTGSIADGSVQVTALGAKAPVAGTQAKLDAVKADLVAGKLHVFDTATFTVEGKTLTSYLADVDTDAAYTGDTEVVGDGYFHESEKRSAPYFNLTIDGIELLNQAF